MEPPIPGFTVFSRSSPYLDLIGPLWSHRGDDGLRFAFVIDERHLNGRGVAHGGVLAGLADVALGYAGALTHDPPAQLITATLTIDYVGTAAPGDVVVSTTDVQKIGRRLGFANCYLSVGDTRIVRASAVFANTTR
ncbi:MAG: PaaI family thioesterase [Gordonia sp. (in: high G+C Gram-positive bacteria)]